MKIWPCSTNFPQPFCEISVALPTNENLQNKNKETADDLGRSFAGTESRIRTRIDANRG
jgi:hypothetical protein